MNAFSSHKSAINLAQEDANLICIGAVFGAAGVRGAVRLKVFTEDIKSISGYGPVTMFGHGFGSGKKVKVKILHNVKGGIAVKLDGIDDRDTATSLRGTKLYIERSVLPKIKEEDDFYFEDLVGLKAKDQNDQFFGVVDGVFNFGAGDIIEVKLSQEEGKNMYPFSDEIVPIVEIEAGYIVINRNAFGDDEEKENTEIKNEKG